MVRSQSVARLRAAARLHELRREIADLDRENLVLCAKSDELKAEMDVYSVFKAEQQCERRALELEHEREIKTELEGEHRALSASLVEPELMAPPMVGLVPKLIAVPEPVAEVSLEVPELTAVPEPVAELIAMPEPVAEASPRQSPSLLHRAQVPWSRALDFDFVVMFSATNKTVLALTGMQAPGSTRRRPPVSVYLLLSVYRVLSARPGVPLVQTKKKSPKHRRMVRTAPNRRCALTSSPMIPEWSRSMMVPFVREAPSFVGAGWKSHSEGRPPASQICRPWPTHWAGAAVSTNLQTIAGRDD